MELDYRKQGELRINMTKYVENMINDFPVKLGKKDIAKTPAADSLFNLGTGAKLDTKRSEISHICGKRFIPFCKRARPDIQQGISVLYVQESRIQIKSGLGKSDKSYEILEWHKG
jgi:hypothetical protein